MGGIPLPCMCQIGLCVLLSRVKKALTLVDFERQVRQVKDTLEMELQEANRERWVSLCCTPSAGSSLQLGDVKLIHAPHLWLLA